MDESQDNRPSMWFTSLALWDGPDTMSMTDESGSQFTFGWQVLRLALRKDKPRIVEARSIYADPHPRWEQPVAILRAVYWNSYVKRPGMATDESPVAARFIEIPMTQALGWISAFDSVTIAPQRHFDSKSPTRTVRIEWDWAASVFQATRQGDPLEESDLRQTWQKVWDEMGIALREDEPVRYVEEGWRIDLSRLEDPPMTTNMYSELIRYDLDSYPPLGIASPE